MQGRNGQSERGGPLISLVLPTFNPGLGLDRTWAEVNRFLQETDQNWEVLFVCDGCTDGSPEILAERVRGLTQRIRVLSHTPNRGKGYAVRQGLAAARGDWRLFTDVDLAYSFDDVQRVAAALQAGAELAIASRSHPQSRLVLPPNLQGYAYRRYLQSLVFSLLARCLLPIAQRDTQAGLKGLSARAATLLLPHLRCNGFGFDCELLTACTRLELTIAEVPVCVRFEDRSSTTGFPMMAQMIRELWSIRRSWKQVPVTSANEQRRAA
jgi:dolichyl-phosphate beta-glucosyltransferase